MKYQVHHIWQSHFLIYCSVRPRREILLLGTIQHPRPFSTVGARLSQTLVPMHVSRAEAASSYVYCSWQWTVRNHWWTCFTLHVTQFLSAAWFRDARTFVQRSLMEASWLCGLDWDNGSLSARPACRLPPRLAVSRKHVRNLSRWGWRGRSLGF